VQYAYTSLRDVIGNVIRNTRIQDSSYIADMHEWLYEAIDQLETQFTLVGKVETLKVNFHKAKLPCGLKILDAVQYGGVRLPEGKGVRLAHKDHPVTSTIQPSVFQTVVGKFEVLQNHEFYATQLIQLNMLQMHGSHYYYTEMGTLNTSFADGEVTIYYQAVEIDEDGYPMIPDNANYKQALYYYCRGMMIGAGWKDPVFDYTTCMTEFERYGGRALAEIRMPSPDQMERRVKNFVRFIPDAGYYDNFFRASEREGLFDTKFWRRR